MPKLFIFRKETVAQPRCLLILQGEWFKLESREVRLQCFSIPEPQPPAEQKAWWLLPMAIVGTLALELAFMSIGAEPGENCDKIDGGEEDDQKDKKQIKRESKECNR